MRIKDKHLSHEYARDKRKNQLEMKLKEEILFVTLKIILINSNIII